MTKILLVEDDNGLREIYNIRLTAEGYDVVAAGDGEQALAVAVQEKPDLVISDVMMPKISGFDMLDILRQTPETKDIKVIMMTALSSEDQRERGNSLGADRYLVKSQVGIEDVVNAVHEVLNDVNGSVSPATAPNLTTEQAQAQMTAPTQLQQPISTPVQAQMPDPASAQTQMPDPTSAQAQMPVQAQVQQQTSIPMQAQMPVQAQAIEQPINPAPAQIPQFQSMPAQAPQVQPVPTQPINSNFLTQEQISGKQAQ